MTAEHAPPRGLRSATLAAAAARRAPAPPGTGPTRPYAAVVAMLDALLTELAGAHWRTPVVNGWTVHELVAHLAATDSLLAAAIGAPPVPPAPAPGDDLDSRTRTVLERARRLPPERTRREWRGQAETLCRSVPEGGGDDRVRVAGWPMRVRDHFLARAFETWVHADDIASATRSRLPPPPVAPLTAIADFGVRSLPPALDLCGTDLGDSAIGLILHGPGGGHWVVRARRATRIGGPRPDGRRGAGATAPRPGEVAAEISLSTLEFCFLAGGRRDPAAVEVEISGEAALARALLVAAPTFAGP